MRRLLSTAKWSAIVFALLLAGALAVNTFPYFNFDPEYKFLRLKQDAIATGWYLPAFYSHVLISGVILIAGFPQFFSKSSQRYKKLHRLLGYVYVMGILFLAAPGGLIMALFIDRGPWVLLSFILLAILWFLFTAKAFSSIRKKDVIAHRQWMWRSYALTFSAITLRVYIFITSYGFDLSQSEAYAALAWLSWVPNLLIVELALKTRFKPII
jgi:uncharacterized membrane protein